MIGVLSIIRLKSRNLKNFMTRLSRNAAGVALLRKKKEGQPGT